MLSRLGARSPLLLRAFLVGVSALAVIVTASAFSAPAARSAAPAGRPETAAAALVPGQAAASAAHLAHLAHLSHKAHLAHLRYLAQLAAQAKWAAAHPAKHETSTPPVETDAKTYSAPAEAGTLTASEVGRLWLEAGGPAWAESRAVEIAHCESGWRTDAENPDGASGLWQIFGSVVPGNLFDPLVNARNAVAKFTASGDTFAQWTCQ